MMTSESKNYFFKCQNIKISIFNAETEDIAWYRLRETLKKDEENFDREMPKAEDFQLLV
jgi:hypothetical protein